MRVAPLIISGVTPCPDENTNLSKQNQRFLLERYWFRLKATSDMFKPDFELYSAADAGAKVFFAPGASLPPHFSFQQSNNWQQTDQWCGLLSLTNQTFPTLSFERAIYSEAGGRWIRVNSTTTARMGQENPAAGISTSTVYFDGPHAGHIS